MSSIVGGGNDLNNLPQELNALNYNFKIKLSGMLRT